MTEAGQVSAEQAWERIAYFLKRYREDMIANKKKQAEIDIKLVEIEA